jgi:hypothetical protein
MPAEAVHGIAHKDAVTRCHLLVYGWIYLIFGVLTALALCVMFTFPQCDI